MTEDISEFFLLIVGFVKLSLVIFFAEFYAMGGTAGLKKFFRTWIGSAFLAGGLISFSIIDSTFRWWFFLLWPALLGWTVLPYSNNDGKGLWRRALTGTVIGSIGIALSLSTGRLGLGIFHFVLCVSASIYLGLRNPVCAVNEQLLIAGLSTVLLPFMI